MDRRLTTTTTGLSVQFPGPRAHESRRPAAAWLAQPSLRLELPEQLQLREQDRLLEVRCGWQALACREHRRLLSSRVSAVGAFAGPSYIDMRRPMRKSDIEKWWQEISHSLGRDTSITCLES
jgi:hypothetical protein